MYVNAPNGATTFLGIVLSALCHGKLPYVSYYHAVLLLENLSDDVTVLNSLPNGAGAELPKRRKPDNPSWRRKMIYLQKRRMR
jgi:hypothetical protein